MGKPLFNVRDTSAPSHEIWVDLEGIASFYDDVVWVTQEGDVWKIPDMETRHIRNCLANILIGRLAQRGNYYPLLAEELKRRNNT